MHQEALSGLDVFVHEHGDEALGIRCGHGERR
jgi:hypothetical protein